MGRIKKFLPAGIAIFLVCFFCAGSSLGQKSISDHVIIPDREDAESAGDLPDLPGTPAYLIGSGDVLNVSVWKDPELSRTLVVLPDGSISLPLIGEITAMGRSVAQLQQEIIERIKIYVPDPVVTVTVQQPVSMMIYVIGKVNSPGRFNIVSNINVLQALAMAGGFNPFAKKDKIKIFRSENGKTRILNFDYEEVSKGKNLEQNVVLKKNDVILVP